MIEDKKFPVIFNEKLNKSNLSDEEAAKLIDVSRITIKNWKAGVTAPHELMYESIFKKLDNFCIYKNKGCNKISEFCKREKCAYAKYFDFLMVNF